MSNRLTQKNPSGKAAIAAFALLAVALIMIVLTTLSSVAYGTTAQISVAAIGLTCLLIGSLSGYLICLAFSRKSVNEAKKLEWQVQDEKLMATVASDKEKLLEAKVATLEAALKNALKKI